MKSPIRGSGASLRDFLGGFPKDEHGNALMQDYVPGNRDAGGVDPAIKAITDRFRARDAKTGDNAMKPIYFAGYRGEGHMFTRPDPFKDEILAFFEGIEPVAVAAGYFKDEITGEQVTDREELAYVDGDWTWTAGDVYHFERYDLELSHEFREHATGRLIIDDTASQVVAWHTNKPMKVKR